MVPFDLVTPSSVDEALATLRTSSPGEVVILSGGTDLLLDIQRGRASPRRVLSLRRLPWRTIEWVQGGVRIGSTLPLRELETDPQLRGLIPGLYHAVRAVGGVALRERATLGGNVVRSAPASDLLPILLALDAELELVGPKAERRVSLDAFLESPRRPNLGPFELVRSIWIHVARPSTYLWQRERPVNDISQVAVAVARSPSTMGWQVAVGDVLPRPVRVREAEALLGTGTPSATSVNEAARITSERAPFSTDRRGTEEYRRRVVRVLVERALRALLPPSSRGERT